jgi:hypothetical protein
VDAILFNTSMDHIFDYNTAIEEAHHILKPAEVLSSLLMPGLSAQLYSSTMCISIIFVSSKFWRLSEIILKLKIFDGMKILSTLHIAMGYISEPNAERVD